MKKIYKCKECGVTFDKYPILCDFCRGKEFEIKEEETMSCKTKQGLNQCVCWSKYGKSLNSGIKCSNCGREL